MALSDIEAPVGDYLMLAELPFVGIGSPLNDIETSQHEKGLRVHWQHYPGWPAVGDVKIGITYGPTGVEYTGTYSPGGGGSPARPIGSAVVRRIKL